VSNGLKTNYKYISSTASNASLVIMPGILPVQGGKGK
jgi:hypothetical protein